MESLQRATIILITDVTARRVHSGHRSTDSLKAEKSLFGDIKTTVTFNVNNSIKLNTRDWEMGKKQTNY